MKVALVLAAVILYGSCSAAPTEVSNTKKPSQNEESQSQNGARATATASSFTKTGSKSSAGNSGQVENQESGSFGKHELKDSAVAVEVKAIERQSGSGGQGSGNFGGRGSIGFKTSGGFGGRGSISFGDQESEGDYLVKNYPYGGYDSDGEYEEQDDGYSNQEESGNYNDIDLNSQSNDNARGDIGGLSAALLLAHHANLAHLLHLSHHLYVPEIIGLNFLTRGVPGGGLMNIWPLHHLTNHKLKEFMYYNALAKSLPNLVKSNLPGHGKALGMQSAGLQISGRGWSGQDARGYQGKRLIY